VAWIESHQELRDHWKAIRLAELLEVGMPQVIGHLHLLWWWAVDYATDGDLSRFTDGVISRAARWDGDPERFVASLHEAGFLDRGSAGYALHDWDQYAGRLIEQRERSAERARTSREARRAAARNTAEPCAQRARSVRATSPHAAGTDDAACAQRAALPDRTIPDRTEPDRTWEPKSADEPRSQPQAPPEPPQPHEPPYWEAIASQDPEAAAVHELLGQRQRDPTVFALLGRLRALHGPEAVTAAVSDCVAKAAGGGFRSADHVRRYICDRCKSYRAGRGVKAARASPPPPDPGEEAYYARLRERGVVLHDGP
jgi:hypothetical protein